MLNVVLDESGTSRFGDLQKDGRFAIIGSACRRGVAQPGSALEWGSRGPAFESRRPDQYMTRDNDPDDRIWVVLA